MSGFILRRLLMALPVLWGVVTLVFFIIHLTPGDPVEVMLGENATSADREALRHELGLDRPVLEQYVTYLAGVVRLDFGRSLSAGKPVADAIAETFPATLQLAGAAMLLAVTLAIPLGVIAAARKDRWIDRGAMTLSLLGVSMPSFWIGPLLILVFAIDLKWLPVSGRGGIEHLVLPAITLGTAMAAILSRLTRAATLEALGEDYIVTARAKGLSGGVTLFKHALANALLPVVTVAGLQLGALLAGAIITETIFSWPGVGRLVIGAINARDYPLAQGCVLAIALTYTLVNLAVDLLYGIIDPRVRVK
ncbi:MAG: ABC transporter permease, partial [Nitrospinae bacterium]|nr:ABC transporter permease [Nitrospinota bacterium]